MIFHQEKFPRIIPKDYVIELHKIVLKCPEKHIATKSFQVFQSAHIYFLPRKSSRTPVVAGFSPLKCQQKQSSFLFKKLKLLKILILSLKNDLKKINSYSTQCVVHMANN